MNRETFLTLNKTRLFTVDQVVDIVQSERDTCPQNKIWQHCPVAEQIRKQERDKVLEDLEKDMHEHYDFVAAQYNIQGGAYYRGRKELYEQIFEKLVELQCSKREGQG